MAIVDFGKERDYIEEIREIREWALKLRRLRPRVDTDWKEPADWVIKDANVHGRPARSLTITLMPTGCEWASTGGCTMCGEFEGSTKSTIVPAMFHVAQFASAAGKYVQKYRPSWLRIYQEGNFTNKNEIENSAQSTVIRLASLIKGVKRITIESMAKYITKDGLKFLDKMVERDVELEIGMGFECENDVVRNVCVNKGERIGDYRRAVGLLKEKGIRSLAYVLLKPPFLSEGEAVEEAISTIKMAREIGFDAISLEPLSIHAFTLVHALSTEGLYQLPWLWSVVKVAQSAKWIPDFRIGGAGFYPRPINVASNKHPDRKDGCNKRLWTAIRKYGKTRNLALFKGLDCVCREEWDKECQRSAEPLRDRIREQLRRLDIDRYASFVSGQGLVMQPSVKFAEGVAGGTQYRRD